MFDKLLEIFDGESEQNSIFGLLRVIRFDTEYQQTIKSFEKYLCASYNIEDAKGNPGSVGHFYLTNLRVIWQMKSQPTINLSFGLDSINSTDIKTIPVQSGNGFKYNFTVKAQNPSQTKYEFKFSGIHLDDLRVFQKIAELHKKVSQTKQFRFQNLTLKTDQNYKTMQNQQIRSEYSNVTFIDDQFRCSCYLVLTNARLIIIKDSQKKNNWGVPWLMIRSVEFSAESDIFRGVRLFCRGILAPKNIMLYCINQVDTKKLEFQLKSFAQVYNKAPILGYNYQEQKQKIQVKKQQKEQIQQFEVTKININRRKNAYATTGQIGSLVNTQFNKQIGLMMQKLPEGTQRADLWEILK